MTEKQGFNTRTITRTYDAEDRVTSYTDTDGNTVRYGYDEFGNRSSLTYELIHVFEKRL